MNGKRLIFSVAYPAIIFTGLYYSDTILSYFDPNKVDIAKWQNNISIIAGAVNTVLLINLFDVASRFSSALRICKTCANKKK
jgi:hypothetical protein